MSYKHNNLYAMRERYWDDQHDAKSMAEKQSIQRLLAEYQVFHNPTLEDARYLFFTLPSIIIVKGHALGFEHESVQTLIRQHLARHMTLLKKRGALKIKFRM